MNIYREQILEHFKEPMNKGILEDADVTHKEKNPLCGDEIEISLKLEKNKIKDIKFQGKGCVISQAAASMLTEYVKWKTISELNELGKDDIMGLIEVPLGPVRLKCAMLSLDTLKNAILIYNKYICGGKNGISGN